ncbi:MAG: serine hydrolase [Candidatus Aenigmatarchaeota archaeon]
MSILFNRRRDLFPYTLIIILAFFNIVLLYNSLFIGSSVYSSTVLLDSKDQNYDFLSPYIADLTTKEFLEEQKEIAVYYKPLRILVADILEEKTEGDYGFYFEDLNSGAWIGINEKEKFNPGSLIKVTTIASILKKVENGDLNLDDKLEVLPEDLDYNFGDLALRGAGRALTVDELIEMTAKESDNTASNVLKRIVTIDDLVEASLSMGLPLRTFFKTDSQEANLISPKEYSNAFRSLYLSSYLRRPFSQMLLSDLSDTIFNSQLKAGIPSNVKVAHKIGIEEKTGSYHDCGIVYSNKYYLICIMSKNTNEAEANRIISKISQTVYNYVTNN